MIALTIITKIKHGYVDNVNKKYGRSRDGRFFNETCIISQIMMINGVFYDFWKITHLSLTHCGRVTPYGDGSMLFNNPIFFTTKTFPQI